MTSREQNRSLRIVAIVVVATIAMRFGYALFSHTTGKVDPHINLTEDKTRELIEKQRQQQLAAFYAVDDGEVSRTEQRIREATALATAVSLFAANESLNRRAPANANVLLLSLKNSGLLPPGLQTNATDGSVVSSHANLLVRYRSEPLGIEIVSLGKASMDGPMLVVRVLSSQMKDTNQEGSNIYVATSLEQSKVPSPFASEAEIFALGFQRQKLPATKLSHP
jgi:hypothetical protein